MARQQKEISLRGQRHMHILNALYSTVRQLKEDATTSRDDVGSLAAEMRVLSMTVSRVSSAQQGPLDEWYTEVKKAFLFLMDQVEKARKESEDAKDNAQAAELLHEEERSRSLMLEDDKSKLEHEVSSTCLYLSVSQSFSFVVFLLLSIFPLILLSSDIFVSFLWS